MQYKMRIILIIFWYFNKHYWFLFHNDSYLSQQIIHFNLSWKIMFYDFHSSFDLCFRKLILHLRNISLILYIFPDLLLQNYIFIWNWGRFVTLTLKLYMVLWGLQVVQCQKLPSLSSNMFMCPSGPKNKKNIFE